MRLSALVFFVLFLASQLAAPAHAQGGTDYRLGVGDKVKVVVFGQPDLTGEAEIDHRRHI